MNRKSYRLLIITGALVVSLFTMCTKTKIEAPAVKAPALDAETASLATQVIGTGTYTVKTTDWMVDGSNIAPGTTIYVPAGTRGALLFKNLKGTPTAPITIVNKGGKVTFSTSTSSSYGFKTQNCTNFKVLGNGVSTIRYGFEVNGGNIGMTMDDLSSDFEIANIEVHNSGFAGIMAKTDPSCDPATWRGHFTMRNVIIHGNYVHNTGGEGLYVGNSFYQDGVSTSCGTVLPHDVVNAKIYKNITDSTGSEGIQVGSATKGCAIYANEVKNPGVSPFSAYQDNGIQIGEGTGGLCYNNSVKNAPGNGIIVLGLGDNVVYNNYILNSKSYGIFADSRYTPGPHFQFINNTIVASALGGIKLNSETIPMNTVVNNVIIQSASLSPIIRKSNSVKLTAINNYVSNNVAVCKFVNYTAGDFHLLPSSPLVDKGVNGLLYGINVDYYNVSRPSGKAFDIGATEYPFSK